eukprot:2261521-Rhodomonas_salina.1
MATDLVIEQEIDAVDNGVSCYPPDILPKANSATCLRTCKTVPGTGCIRGTDGVWYQHTDRVSCGFAIGTSTHSTERACV